MKTDSCIKKEYRSLFFGRVEKGLTLRPRLFYTRGQRNQMIKCGFQAAFQEE